VTFQTYTHYTIICWICQPISIQNKRHHSAPIELNRVINQFAIQAQLALFAGSPQ